MRAFTLTVAVIGVVPVRCVVIVVRLVLMMMIVGEQLDVRGLQLAMKDGRQPEHRQQQGENWTEA